MNHSIEAEKNDRSPLMVSVARIRAVQDRNATATASDGGTSGKSDTNDKCISDDDQNLDTNT